MAVEISTTYIGELRCEAVHGPSKSHLVTDAPTDNQGKGESFSPTDLVATALGTCILTTMGILAARYQWDLSGTTAHVTKDMVTSPFRRIGKLTTTVTFPKSITGRLTPEEQQKLENAALTCPVHRSLHSDVEKPIEFVWG